MTRLQEVEHVMIDNITQQDITYIHSIRERSGLSKTNQILMYTQKTKENRNTTGQRKGATQTQLDGPIQTKWQTTQGEQGQTESRLQDAQEKAGGRLYNS